MSSNTVKPAPKKYICDRCDPPCIIRIKKHAVLLSPPDRWFEKPADLKSWCAEGQLRPVKRGRPKKPATSSSSKST